MSFCKNFLAVVDRSVVLLMETSESAAHLDLFLVGLRMWVDVMQRAKHVYTEAARVHDFRGATLHSDRCFDILTNGCKFL